MKYSCKPEIARRNITDDDNMTAMIYMYIFLNLSTTTIRSLVKFCTSITSDRVT